MEILRQNILFSSLSDAQYLHIVESAKRVNLTESEVLFRQQTKADYFYLLETGDIKLYRLAPNGSEKVIELIRAGQTFAEAVMFMHGNFYPVNAQALSKSQLIRIDMEVYRDLLEHSPETSLKILGYMSQRLHGLIQEIEQVSLQNAKIRMIQFLLSELPSGESTPYIIQWNTPKTVLASRLSIRPETFSRILQQLSQEGLIAVDKKSIEILNIEQLKAL